MSKRYGRNQKRRNRETIEALSKEVASQTNFSTSLRGVISQKERTVAELNETINLCKEILGPDFVAFNPEVMKVYHLDSFRPDRYKVDVSEKMSLTPDISMGNNVVLQFHRIDILPMIFDYEKHSKWDRHQKIHFTMATPDGTVAYGVSDDFLRKTPRPTLIKILAREFAGMIARKFQGAEGK